MQLCGRRKRGLVAGLLSLCSDGWTDDRAVGVGQRLRRLLGLRGFVWRFGGSVEERMAVVNGAPVSLIRWLVTTPLFPPFSFLWNFYLISFFSDAMLPSCFLLWFLLLWRLKKWEMVVGGRLRIGVWFIVRGLS